ncbi:hypothetical protein [Paraburkholderia bannensis]|uniref:hypothetical protein n=1 Tax=Paraburkholderia bannensis TaxID=765414 RepID=UPI0012EBD8FB|nr:hypothetical protein [Paraburkholderia bannensis]
MLIVLLVGIVTTRIAPMRGALAIVTVVAMRLRLLLATVPVAVIAMVYLMIPLLALRVRHPLRGGTVVARAEVVRVRCHRSECERASHTAQNT